MCVGALWYSPRRRLAMAPEWQPHLVTENPRESHNPRSATSRHGAPTRSVNSRCSVRLHTTEMTTRPSWRVGTAGPASTRRAESRHSQSVDIQGIEDRNAPKGTQRVAPTIASMSLPLVRHLNPHTGARVLRRVSLPNAIREVDASPAVVHRPRDDSSSSFVTPTAAPPILTGRGRFGLWGASVGRWWRLRASAAPAVAPRATSPHPRRGMALQRLDGKQGATVAESDEVDAEVL